MKFAIDHDLHIHSQLSECSSNPQQTPERILQYAGENGMHTVCLTDHYWDSAVPGPSDWYAPQNDAWIRQALPLPRREGIRFLFGCETEMRADLTLGISRGRMDEFDLILIPTTHLHMTGFVITKADAASLERRVQLWVERLDALLGMDLPFRKIGIPHLTCSLCRPGSRAGYLEMMSLLPEKEMHRLFDKAAAVGVGIELNSDDMRFTPEEADTVLRPYRIAKECGCKFYLGSDAHAPRDLDAARDIFTRAVALLDLKEEDKFVI